MTIDVRFAVYSEGTSREPYMHSCFPTKRKTLKTYTRISMQFASGAHMKTAIICSITCALRNHFECDVHAMHV